METLYECGGRPGERARGRALILVAVLLAALCATHAGAAMEREVQGFALVAGRPAPNVVVWFDAPNARRSRGSEPVVLDQRNLRFTPQVLAIRVGTVVRFPNNDRVFHNVFSFHHGKVFDLGLYPVGESKVVRFDTPGLSRIFCNIHPNMAAYVFAVDSPFFAVSDGEGRFALPSVPEGQYRYHAWRSGAPEVAGEWTVDAGEAALSIEWAK